MLPWRYSASRLSAASCRFGDTFDCIDIDLVVASEPVICISGTPFLMPPRYADTRRQLFADCITAGASTSEIVKRLQVFKMIVYRYRRNIY